MTKDTTVVGVRVGADELTKIDALAQQRSCSRSEALRLVLDYGLPLANHGFKVDVTRLIFILEHLGASIDVIMARDHGDIYPRLETLVNKRMEQFHA